jgi:glutamyl-tRNA reductase
MSVLVVGLSHSSAPVTTLERAVVSGDALTKLLRDVHQAEYVAGSLVISTCNRVEVYAEVDRFHGGVAAICELLARHSGLTFGELTGSAYVHYEDRAVQHLLAVACGLESMVIGESQILGQVRQAVKLARQNGTLSRELSDVSRLALRVGRRARAETGIDAAGQNLVTRGLELAARSRAAAPGGQPGAANRRPRALAGVSVLVIGAGSMSALTVATAVRQGAAQVVIANRTPARATRLAARYGANAAGLAGLAEMIAAADLVVACTGAAGHIVTASLVERALAERSGRPAAIGPLVLLDLALPRDVETAVGQLPGVELLDLEAIGAAEAADGSPRADATWAASEADIDAVRRIVTQELAAHLRADRAATVAPTVVALRAKAATVVEAELARLDRRLGDLDDRTRREIAQTMGRITDKLLHGPTVRVKELAGAPGADSYEMALRVLFELDPEAVDAVSAPAEDVLAYSLREASE